jgi:hypothetical protein
MHNYAHNTVGDWGIIRASENASFWNPYHPLLLLHAGGHGNGNTRYEIHQTGTTNVGMRVCMTGASSGSACGTVDRVDEAVTSDDGVTTRGTARVHGFCGSPGDSGGPTFSYNIGYGLVVAVRDVPFQGCRVYYSGIHGAANNMNVYINCRNARVPQPTACNA